MPVELRRIIFTQEELTAALAMIQRSDGKGLPKGDVTNIKIGEDGALTAAIALAGSDKPSEHALTGDQMRDLLIRFCVQNKIPLPRAAEKSCITHEGKAALMVKSVDLETEAADALAGTGG